MMSMRTPPRSRGATPAVHLDDLLHKLDPPNLNKLLREFGVSHKISKDKKKLIQRVNQAGLDEDLVREYTLELLQSENIVESTENASEDENDGTRRAPAPRKPNNDEPGRHRNKKAATRTRDTRSPSGDEFGWEEHWNKSQSDKRNGKSPQAHATEPSDDLVDRLNRLRGRFIGKEPNEDKSSNQTNDEQAGGAPLDDAEQEIMNSSETNHHLPALTTVDPAMQTLTVSLSPEYKRLVKKKVEHFWWFANSALENENLSPSQAIQAITNFAHHDVWDKWWPAVANDATEARRWKQFQAYVRSVRQKHGVADTTMTSPRASNSPSDPLSPAPPTDDENYPYDCKGARVERKRYHGLGNPKADEMELDDPDNPGQIVKADIIGRHPARRNWLALALPSNNPDCMLMSRGIYIDGTKDAYKDAFNRYVKKGSNIILSTATNREHLNEAEPEDFELNLVLFMPWGRYFHTHAYGIPHFDKKRDFMLYSKSLLSSAWGTSAADDILRDHCQQAGQEIPKSSKTRKIRKKAWKHD